MKRCVDLRTIQPTTDRDQVRSPPASLQSIKGFVSMCQKYIHSTWQRPPTPRWGVIRLPVLAAHVCTWCCEGVRGASCVHNWTRSNWCIVETQDWRSGKVECPPQSVTLVTTAFLASFRRTITQGIKTPVYTKSSKEKKIGMIFFHVDSLEASSHTISWTWHQKCDD